VCATRLQITQYEMTPTELFKREMSTDGKRIVVMSIIADAFFAKCELEIVECICDG
jgi:hypothetical protein